MNHAYLKTFITAGIALIANIAQAQSDTTLNQPNQTGTFVAPDRIVLGPRLQLLWLVPSIY